MPLYSKEKVASAPKDNKSVLSYWPGVSISGSTKHIPGFAAVSVPIKSAVNQRDTPGPIVNQDILDRALAAEARPTTYGQTHIIDPRHDYTVDPRHGDGYWNKVQAPAALADPRPFLGKTTYQDELTPKPASRNPAPAAATAAASRLAAPTQEAHALQPPAVKPGFLTNYTAATLPLARKLGAAAAAGGQDGGLGIPRPDSTAAGAALDWPRSNRGSLAGACSVMSRFEAQTMYGSMYSGEAPHATEELNRGTARTSMHVAGYGGHVPSDSELVLAGLSSRVKKEDALLYHLDQHSRGLVPGYSGHRTTHKPAVSLDAAPPTITTTQGAAHQEVLRWSGRSVPGAPLNSRAGVLGFFSSGSGGGAFVSENGLADAALFHQKARPYEGYMKVPRPSVTNCHGAKFSS